MAGKRSRVSARWRAQSAAVVCGALRSLAAPSRAWPGRALSRAVTLASGPHKSTQTPSPHLGRQQRQLHDVKVVVELKILVQILLLHLQPRLEQPRGAHCVEKVGGAWWLGYGGRGTMSRTRLAASQCHALGQGVSPNSWQSQPCAHLHRETGSD